MCVFCDKEPMFETELSKCFYDTYPVTLGHLLIIPKRHAVTYFNLLPEEQADIWELVIEMRRYLSKKFRPDGFNVGTNVGKAAGQTVMHAHIHLIPRYDGDMDDPAGGVRGVIPGKQKY